MMDDSQKISERNNENDNFSMAEDKKTCSIAWRQTSLNKVVQ